MSEGTLLFTETGRILPTVCEEITAHRRVRKVLAAPANLDNKSTLFLHVRRYPQHTEPLLVRVNGLDFEYGPGPAQEHLHWAELELPPGTVRAGENLIELASRAVSQTGWTISMEAGHENPGSYLSTNGGATWQNRRMGLYHVLRGEYLVRLRTGGAEGALPPVFIWEDRDHPRLKEFRKHIPVAVQTIAGAWDRTRALASWVSAQFVYKNAADQATVYTPWDPFTILAWEPGGRVHGQAATPIRMCMHYGVLFVCACLACGIPARSIIATSSIRRLQGHFAAEVWDTRRGQWALVDPNLDLVMIDRGRPLGAGEVFRYPLPLAGLLETGPATEGHRARLAAYLDKYAGAAEMLRHTAVWPRNDFFSRPEQTPACHGQEVYTETEIVWRNRNDAIDELAMFPLIAGDDWFDQPPPDSWLVSS